MLVDREGRNRTAWFVLVGYGVVLLLLLPLRPLWLDELMEVVATARLPIHDVIAGYAAHSAGQSPLGAAEQAFSIAILGFSSFAARIPAALANLLGCVGILFLAGRAGLLRAWIPLVLLASFPIVLRYGTEARPYSQALCIAAWLNLVFVELEKRPGVRLLVIYGLLLAIGLYTQPYVLFAAAAHGAFLAVRKRWSVLLPMAAVTLAAGCAYLPWYLHSRGFWKQEIEASQLHFHLQAKLALLIPRELIGAGYIGTLVVALLSIYGFAYFSKRGDDWLLWFLNVVVPICMIVLADLVFDYFFAIRQVIFVLPALAILAAGGLERLWEERGGRLALAVAGLLFALDTGYAIRQFTKPRENWSAAAEVLHRYVQSGACVIALPSGSSEYFEFFRPDLKGHQCGSLRAGKVTSVAVAVSPYLIDRASEAETRAQLRAAGFRLSRRLSGEPRVEHYVAGL